MLWRFWSWSVQFCSDFLCPDCFLIKAILFKINSFLIIILYGLLNDFSLKENKYHLKIHRNEEKSSDTAYTIHRSKVILYKLRGEPFLWNRILDLGWLLLVRQFRVCEFWSLFSKIGKIDVLDLLFCFINFPFFEITTLCWPNCEN